MSRRTAILSISLPNNLTKAVDALSKQTAQTRSELIRHAVKEYLLDLEDDRQRFLDAYKATRKEKAISMDAFRKKYGLK